MPKRTPEQKENRRLAAQSPEVREKNAEAQKRWREKNPESSDYQSFKKKLKNKYKITVEEYEDLLIRQNGVCAICRTASTATKGGRRLAVDHDHKTGKVRGLVCMKHNALLGCADDSEVILLSAIDYLRRHV